MPGQFRPPAPFREPACGDGRRAVRDESRFSSSPAILPATSSREIAALLIPAEWPSKRALFAGDCQPGARDGPLIEQTSALVLVRKVGACRTRKLQRAD